MREFRKQYWISWKPLISWLLALDLGLDNNFLFTEVDFVADRRRILINRYWIS